MEKIIIILLLLSACEKHRTMACEHWEKQKQIYLDIEADYDQIDSILVNEVFVIPYHLLANENSMEDLRNQLDDTYHFEENKLIHSYYYEFDGVYSLSATVDYLRDKNYVCR
ncbi:MAG: hypothetical protein IKS51_04080 [Erysipelotrichaceae bacterium]|nr:hypothetical protein [Erysipelotrichaceae bacterium]